MLAVGPDDFNGYGYFYVRLYWTGFGFQAPGAFCEVSARDSWEVYAVQGL